MCQAANTQHPTPASLASSHSTAWFGWSGRLMCVPADEWPTLNEARAFAMFVGKCSVSRCLACDAISQASQVTFHAVVAPIDSSPWPTPNHYPTPGLPAGPPSLRVALHPIACFWPMARALALFGSCLRPLDQPGRPPSLLHRMPCRCRALPMFSL